MTQILVISGFGQEGERIMKQGIDAGLFQGDDLTRAKRTQDAAKRKADAERAALPKAAGQVGAAKTGDEIVNVAKVFFGAGDYPHAAATLQKGVAKGGLADPDAANMLLGISLKRAGDKAGANKAFDAVKEPKFAEVAKLWKTASR
jgi:Flp pilus assembly protein TadD